MTEQKSFKRKVRARMEKTGESYTAARRQLIEPGGVRVDPALDPVAALAAIELDGKPGFTDMDAAEIARFQPIAGVEIPVEPYELVGFDAGEEFLNVPPGQALPAILAAGRSPLTIAEGLTVLLRDPELLGERNCFSLLGSRRGDRRVPVLWIKADGRPRLGWCWEGAPHTWLGSASCAGRVAN
jgi:hypothetical protein